MNETKRNNVKKFYFGDYQGQLNISTQNFPRLFSNLISSNVIYIIHKSRHTFHLAFEKRIIEESLTQR